jgi:hypothetical protein
VKQNAWVYAFEAGAYENRKHSRRTSCIAHSKVVDAAFYGLYRILLACGFIPPSIKKILHQPFTMLPDSNRSAIISMRYMKRVSITSSSAGAVDRGDFTFVSETAHFGALMFLPIIANIAVLTTSVGFVGTWLADDPDVACRDMARRVGIRSTETDLVSDPS